MNGFAQNNRLEPTFIHPNLHELKTYVTPTYSETFKDTIVVNTKQLNKDRLSKMGRSTYGPQKLTRKK